MAERGSRPGQRDDVARRAAEILLGVNNIRGMEGSDPASNLSYTMHDQYLKALISGGLLNDKSMSPVRRFFALFVTFDVLFTTLIWIIITLISGEPLIKAFEEQVSNYSIKSSFFDIMIASAVRFIILITAYVILRLNHWFTVAVTTFLSSALLMGKVFLLDWSHIPNPMFQVLFILASFVLAWSEAWLLDFRVLPQEKRAREIIAQVDNERTALLHSIEQGIHSYNTGRPTSRGPSSTFYSPLESPYDSDGEDERGTEATGSGDRFTDVGANSLHDK